MVLETNRNASQVIFERRLRRSSRLRKWRPTNCEEIKKFLGLLLWMGLVNLPRISDYWSQKILYKNTLVKNVMSRNRFQLLLRFWHFNNNHDISVHGRLSKIEPLVSHLNKVFSDKRSPGENIVVDESVIPFRGRLLFRQYLPNKTHKYGIKVFKICDCTGYTFKMKVYMGKGTGIEENFSLAASVVLDLVKDYLDKGHTLYVDNFYTSVDLAGYLLTRETHLAGTVTSNRAWFPHSKCKDDVKNLKSGEMTCLEYTNGIVYTVWMDKRLVRMMSTKHPPGYTDTGKKTRQGNPILKPLVVQDYNRTKIGIDVSDQMSSYSTTVRKSMRWYHKAAEEMLLGTAVVNAWLSYNEINKNISKNQSSIVSFREKLVYSLLNIQDGVQESPKFLGHHYLVKNETYMGEGKNKRRVRGYCTVCYKNFKASQGRKKAKNMNKVTTVCEQCPGKPYLCAECFKNLHK